MFSPTIHTDFARQLQQDRLAGVRIERRTASGALTRLTGRLFRRPARVPAAPVDAITLSA